MTKKATAKKAAPYDVQAVGKAICEQLSNGKSLRRICLEPGMPDVGTFLRWLADDANAALRLQYARAREAYADGEVDSIIDLADESDPAEAHKVRLQIDARKWALARMHPRKYGDKLDVTSDGEKIPPLLVVKGPADGSGGS